MTSLLRRSSSGKKSALEEEIGKENLSLRTSQESMEGGPLRRSVSRLNELRTSEGHRIRRSSSGSHLFDSALMHENKFSIILSSAEMLITPTADDSGQFTEVVEVPQVAHVTPEGDRIENSILRKNPRISYPTLALFVSALLLKWLSIELYIKSGWMFYLCLGASALSSYLLFTVVHDCVHGAFCFSRKATAVVGRVSAFVFSPIGSYVGFKVAHLMHHRYVNDPIYDPDLQSAHSPIYVTPFIWIAQLFYYVYWYVRNYNELPRGPVLETFAIQVPVCALFAFSYFYNRPYFDFLLWVWLVPGVCSAMMLAATFDWLPHHPDEDIVVTTRADRYHTAALIQVGDGKGWGQTVLDVVLCNQTYHLAHHLWPTVPFYRYQDIWNERIDEVKKNKPFIRRIF